MDVLPAIPTKLSPQEVTKDQVPTVQSLRGVRLKLRDMYEKKCENNYNL